MDAIMLLAELRRRGIVVEAVGDQVHCRPSAALDDELRQAIDRHRADLLALLATPPVPAAEPARTDQTAAAVDQPATTGEALSADAVIVVTPVGFRQVVELRPDGVALTCAGGPDAPPDRLFGAWKASVLRDDGGCPLVALGDADRARWTTDPRADLAADRDRWRQLLMLADRLDGDDPGGVYGALRGLRCLGAQLVADVGGVKLVAGEIDADEYQEQRRLWLLPHAPALRRLLRQISVSEEA